MKKNIFTIGTLLILLSTLAACRKDHECECSFDDGMGGRLAQTFLIKSYKNDARAACVTYEKNYAQMSNVSCDLK